MPIDGFGINGTHLNTGATIGAYRFINRRSRAYSILDERPQTPATGGDIFSLREILGHTTLDMVNHYLHFTSSSTTLAVASNHGKIGFDI